MVVKTSYQRSIRSIGAVRPASCGAPSSGKSLHSTLLQHRTVSLGRSNAFVSAVNNAAKQASPAGSKLATQAALNIVFVSAEVAPWSKTGGLGDVVGGLPVELAKRGHRVMTVAPRYDQYHDAWDTSVTLNIMGEDVRYFHVVKNGVDRVFVDHPSFLAKVWGKTGSMLYGPRSGMDYADNQVRFRMFCQAAIEAARVLPFSPGENVAFVANDWHSALVPVLLKNVYKPAGQFAEAKCAFCVHNIAFQGRFWEESFKDLQLPESCRNIFQFTDGYSRIFDETSPAGEDEVVQPSSGRTFDKINWLKAGFLAADKSLTVSPNYAAEVAGDASKGVELDSVIRRIGGLEGIVNGMDVTEWNPQTDKFLDVKFNKETVNEGKAAAKETLQAEAGLPVAADVPLFGFIGRLEEQKGVDILLASLGKALANGRAQVIVLGTGKRKFETMVKKLETQFPGAAKGIVKFSAPLAHLITAGADYMMVPSRFEPCGLIQLHAMQYGTLPLVASTGGLVDTVKEGKTGFQMGSLDPDELVDDDVDAVASTMQRAIEVYGTPAFYEMRFNAINQDLSWKKPAQKWEAVIEEMIHGSFTATAKKADVKTPVSLI